MKIKYIYSACIELETDNCRILMDPWFTDGAYDGSWYQYPKVDPFSLISKPDLIYISHIHPDHYDPTFLRKLFDRYGDIPIIIPDLKNNFLRFRALFDGFNPTPVKEKFIGNTRVVIKPNYTDSISDIDSALYIYDGNAKKSFLNLNDCLYKEELVKDFKRTIKMDTNKLDFLALGYMGAGPYPQTFFEIDDTLRLKSEAEKKKQKFFENYSKFTSSFDAEFNLPFAGEYFLGGKLSKLNDFRGNPDALEVKNFDDRAVTLCPGGSVNLISKEIQDERSEPLDKNELKDYLEKISKNKMKYENDINIQFSDINFARLLKSATKKAHSKLEYEDDYSFIFSIKENNIIKKRFSCDVQNLTVEEVKDIKDLNINYYSEIIIDYRYLFGLLTTIYHWDNAAVGSHYSTRRSPQDFYSRAIVNYLNFFSAV